MVPAEAFRVLDLTDLDVLADLDERLLLLKRLGSDLSSMRDLDALLTFSDAFSSAFYSLLRTLKFALADLVKGPRVIDRCFRIGGSLSFYTLCYSFAAASSSLVGAGSFLGMKKFSSVSSARADLFWPVFYISYLLEAIFRVIGPLRVFCPDF